MGVSRNGRIITGGQRLPVASTELCAKVHLVETLVSANWRKGEQGEMGQNMVSWICEKQAVHEVTHFCNRSYPERADYAD
jgi:hypothetical protein